MNVVLIVPTGIGAEIGGHAGDANPVAKLLGACSDILITHPNVLNASDINEMPENALYVEGSTLDRFLEGTIGLQRVRQNTILVACNAPAQEETINAVNAARATIGIDAFLLELETPLLLTGTMNEEDGAADGHVDGWRELAEQTLGYRFNALAIHTPITVEREVALEYYRKGGVNPWGKVEAMASKLISECINKPVAHAPLENTPYEDRELYAIFECEVVDPRIAPEAISNCYLHSVLKGLNQAPRLVDSNLRAPGIWSEDVDVLVSPWGCWGRPHEAARKLGVPVIMVQENKTVLEQHMGLGDFITAANYWEAAGIIKAMDAGVCPKSVRRPLGALLPYGRGHDRGRHRA